MADKTIRFFEVPADSGALALAEVTLFPGVALRGWQVMQRESEIEILLPISIYDDPDTGKEAVFELLCFESEKTRALWMSRVKDEFAKWQKLTPKQAPAVISDIGLE